MTVIIFCLILLTRLWLSGQTLHHQQTLLELPNKDCQLWTPLALFVQDAAICVPKLLEKVSKGAGRSLNLATELLMLSTHLKIPWVHIRISDQILNMLDIYDS